MAPSQILSSFLSTSILLLLFISPSTCYSSLPNYKVATNHQPADDQKVNLSLYYETLCPGCQDFIIGANGLIRLFKEDGLLSIVNLRLVPWGNAKLTQNDEIVCQHGEEECYYNTIHACIINALPNTIMHFKMIYCTEYLLKANNSSGREVWRECAQNLHYPQEPIQKCYESGLGKQLELAYGKETSDLHPPHDFTPWVVVNGQPLREHYMDYISYICKAYKGKNPPKVCHNSAPRNKMADSSDAGICVRDNYYYRDLQQKPPKVRGYSEPPPSPKDLHSLIPKLKNKS